MKQEPFITIPLSEYNELVDIRKGVQEKKAIVIKDSCGFLGFSTRHSIYTESEFVVKAARGVKEASSRLESCYAQIRTLSEKLEKEKEKSIFERIIGV